MKVRVGDFLELASDRDYIYVRLLDDLNDEKTIFFGTISEALEQVSGVIMRRFVKSWDIMDSDTIWILFR